jgi:hypothetical protein
MSAMTSLDLWRENEPSYCEISCSVGAVQSKCPSVSLDICSDRHCMLNLCEEHTNICDFCDLPFCEAHLEQHEATCPNR